MTTTLLGFALALSPFLMVIALLRLADHMAGRRQACAARQIALTDAIHRELGAAAAPVVSRRLGGGWLVSMAAPLDRPGTTAALVRITERMFAPDAGTKRLRIVLTPRTARPAAPGTSMSSRPRRVGPAAPALPALR